MKEILLNSNNWQELKSQTDLLTNKEKGDLFELFTEYYLKLNPKYATKLKNVWRHYTVPPEIRKTLNLPDTDEGIDILAETKDGEFWGIQCKYVSDESKSIGRKYVSTFTELTFTLCKGISHAVVFTNAEKFSRKFEQYGNKLSFCLGEEIHSLDEEYFTRLHSFLKQKTARPKPYSPRPHQKKAIKNAKEHFIKEDNERGKLIFPCGTGKSLTSYWISETLNSHRILVAVPSLSLVKQTLEVWTREAFAKGLDINWIAVCSDDSVGQDASDSIQDLGIEVNTDPEAIASFLKKHEQDRTVIFTTYQSGRVTAEAVRLSGIEIELGLFDEAHKTVGRKDSLFSHMLFDENISIKKRVFMTATERRYRGNSDDLLSMDDFDIYGEDFEMMSFKDAMECEPPILSDYKIITIAIDKSEVEALVRENEFVRPEKGNWNDELESEMLASMIALRKAMKKLPIKHAVTFHSSIARATVFQKNQELFTKYFPEYGELDTFHVSGSTPTAKRSEMIRTFASSERSLITNARCLTEGVDVPDIDCVLFADPKKSTVDIVQAVGRALRRSKGKEFGYVIVPVLIDNEVSEEAEISSTSYDSILTILRALASNDERIIDYFRERADGKRKRGEQTSFEIDIPGSIKIDVDHFADSLELKVWSKLAKLSWRPFEEAREYVRGLGLKSNQEWRDFSKLKEKPKDIPVAPNVIYKQFWKNWGDWLGTGRIANLGRDYLPYEEAKAFVQNLNLCNLEEWRNFCKENLLPQNIPTNPNRIYKNKGWKNFGEWLGTGRIANNKRVFLPFEEARKFVHKLNLRSINEWKSYSKEGNLPENIPSNPNQTYKNKGWVSFSDWLGTKTVATQQRIYLSYSKARKYVLQLNLYGQSEWSEYCSHGNKPDNIPANPSHVYKNKGWINWSDWLGTSNRKGMWRDFADAKIFVRNLQLKSTKQWREFIKSGKKPKDIPNKPDSVYKKEWINWSDWLGTSNISTNNMSFLSFIKAKQVVHNLNLKNIYDWYEYCKSGNRPKTVPSNPQKTYKDRGWKGWKDWLGTEVKND